MPTPVEPRTWNAILRSMFLTLSTTLLFAFGVRIIFFGIPDEIRSLVLSHSQAATSAASMQSSFTYEFRIPGALIEVGSESESTSPYFWLDSGAKLIIEDDVGKTIQGALSSLDVWRIRYAFSNGIDTERGYAPQNIFRLITRSSWDAVRVENSFKVVRDNFTETPNRNASNGLLLMSRYKDADNLYYAGIRVDGHAVLKKKSNGVYYTMAEKEIFPGEYVREHDMNLLPHDEWISLRSETVTARTDAVTIKLYMKRADETQWTQLLSATDDGKKYEATAPITGPFPVGIRTDFMDVEFDNFKVEKI